MNRIITLIIMLLSMSCSEAEETRNNMSEHLEQPVSNNSDMSTDDSALFEDSVSRKIPLRVDNATVIEGTPFIRTNGFILYKGYVTEDRYVIDDRVRLRTEPNLDCETITYLNTGDKVKVFGKTRELEQIDGLANYWYNIVLDDGTEGWMYGAYLRTNMNEMELQYPTSILPEDFKIAGIEKLTNMSELADMLSNDQLKYMSKIRMDGMVVDSFSGLERFTSLQTLDLKNMYIKDLTEVVLSSSRDNWLHLENSEIESFEGLSKIKNLYLLSLNGSHVINLKNIFPPESLRVVSLNNFPQYHETIELLPNTVEQLYLENNGINSLSEIEYLKARHGLQVLYVGGNNFSLEEIMTVASSWGNIKLTWAYL